MTPMLFWGLTPFDFLALAIFMVCWQGYGPFLRWKGKQFRLVASAMVAHRRAWMYSLLGREMKVHDTQILGHIMSTAAFFASTSVIVMGALLGALINLDRSKLPPGATILDYTAPRNPLELKLVLIMAVAVYAFLSFTWCIRQANYAAVMVGAAPGPPLDSDIRNRLSIHMGDIITQVASAYDNGLRSYYFAIGAVLWIVHPSLFIAATGCIVLLLLRRQSTSRTASALRDLADARAPLHPDSK